MSALMQRYLLWFFLFVYRTLGFRGLATPFDKARPFHDLADVAHLTLYGRLIPSERF